jgi:hypothetical protein
MFMAEILIADDSRLKDEMGAMRTWLDHMGSEPTTFRYAFNAGGVVCRVEFTNEDNAVAFAAAFGGHVKGTAAAG